jgi:hypothetical protein
MGLSARLLTLDVFKKADPASGLIAGAGVAFVSGVDLVRFVQARIPIDAENSWSPARVALVLCVVVVSLAAGALTAAAFHVLAKAPAVHAPLAQLPFRRVGLLFGLAVAAGILFRFVNLSRVPYALWADDVSLISPSLALQGRWRDFTDSIRPVMYGVSHPWGSVGVLYLELFRGVLKVLGVTVFGVRFISAAAGTASLITAAWLGRTLLPRGGGTIVGLVLAGLRWHLIMSRWGWNMILLAPLVDLATLLLLQARRSRGWLPAAAAGAVVGIGAHVYLAAWIAAAGLFGFAVWPNTLREVPGSRMRRAALFLAGFLTLISPIFFLDRGRITPYFQRAGYSNVLVDVRSQNSAMPLLASAADTLVSPWFLPDPRHRNDLPGRSRLGLFLGLALAAAFGRALVRRREELSGLLICQGVAAFAGSVAGGLRHLPNGARFVYLADLAAVAIAASALWLLGCVPPGQRRVAGIAVVGIFAVLSMTGARDALLQWGEARTTYDDFGGVATLFARTAARWERFGSVAIDPRLGFEPREDAAAMIRAVRRYRLDPEEPRFSKLFGQVRRGKRKFRIIFPDLPRRPDERPVEWVRDGWDRAFAVVLGSSH